MEDIIHVKRIATHGIEILERLTWRARLDAWDFAHE